MIGILVDKRVPPDDCWASVACGIRFNPVRLAEFPQVVCVVPPLASRRPKHVTIKAQFGLACSPSLALSSGYQAASPDPHRSGPLIKRKYYFHKHHLCVLLLVFSYEGMTASAIAPFHPDPPSH
jgi:hypothetical protein